MKRGEIWTLSGGPDYAGKPRPAVIVQDDQYDATKSITVVIVTTVDAGGPMPRPMVSPSATNGLRASSHLMVDKISTVSKSKIGRRVGALSVEDITRLNRAIVVFLGLVPSGGS